MKKQFSSRNFNADEYWDTAAVKTGFSTGVKTDTITIPSNSFVKDVLVEVVKVPIVAGTAVVVVGDALDADGFVLEQSIVAAKARDVYGNDTDEIGDYLLRYETISNEEKTLPNWQRVGKWYKDGGEVIVQVTVADAAPTVEGQVRVWVKVLRLDIMED